MELKRLDDLRHTELPRVAAPWYADGEIRKAHSGYASIHGLNEALQSFTCHTPWHWSQQEQAFAALQQAIEKGDWVLVLDHNRISLGLAFLRAGDQTHVSQQLHQPILRHRLERRAQQLEHQQRQWDEQRSKNRNRVSGASTQSELAAGPGNRKASMGPHVGSTASTQAPSTPSVRSGLGDDVDQMASKSPSLQKDMAQLKKEKWEFEYGPAGKGSYADRDSVPPKIVVDGAEKGNPAAVTQTLSHEVGHATYNYTPDLSSKSSYVNGALADEGAATMNNIKVQREILANGGPDIGIAGNRANHPVYNKAYDQYLKDGNASTARQTIGQQFGNGEISSVQVGGKNLTYNEYYGSWYDKAYPPKK